MSDAYVVGVDMIKFGRFPERTVPQIGSEAALLALEDCGLKIQQMEALYCGNLYQANAMVGQRILQEIGQTGVPVVNCANACATGATAFREAWMGVKAGVYDLVLAVGVEQMGKGLLKPRGGTTPIPTEGILGSGLMPAVFAEAGVAYMSEHGATFEDFALVSVKNHEHSTKNPLARYRIETPLETVMGSEMIAYPNTKLMCSVNVDGAAAAIVVSERKARQLGLQRAVKVAVSEGGACTTGAGSFSTSSAREPPSRPATSISRPGQYSARPVRTPRWNATLPRRPRVEARLATSSSCRGVAWAGFHSSGISDRTMRATAFASPERIDASRIRSCAAFEASECG